MSSLHIYFRARITFLFFFIKYYCNFFMSHKRGIGTSHFRIKDFIAGSEIFILFSFFLLLSEIVIFLGESIFIDIYRF